MPEPIRKAAKFWTDHWSPDCSGFTLGGALTLAGIALWFWLMGGP
jgi:hypothetical protein